MPERPPDRQQAVLLFEPASDRVLLVVTDDRVLEVDDDRLADHTMLWKRSTRGWTPVARSLFGKHELQPWHAPIAWIDGPSGEVVVGLFASDGMYTVRPGGTETHHGMSPPSTSFNRSFAAFHPRIDRPVLVVPTGSGDSEVLAVAPGRLEPLGRGPSLLALAVDHGTGEIVGCDATNGLLHAFDGRSFRVIGEQHGQGLAWHPGLRAIVTLAYEGEDGVVLAAWNGARFVAVTPTVRSAIYRHNGQLLVTPDGSIVYFGGQDFDFKGGAPTNASLVTGGAGLVQDAAPELPSLGRVTSAVTTAERLVIVNHCSLEALTPAGETWAPFVELPRAQAERTSGLRDDLRVNFAAWGEHLFALDSLGALWMCSRAQQRRIGGDGSSGPGPEQYAHRIAMAYDPPSRRVVLFGGYEIETNTTWVGDPEAGRFEALPPKDPPPAGVGSMVATREGAYLLIHGELHRFTGDGWERLSVGLPGELSCGEPRRSDLAVEPPS